MEEEEHSAFDYFAGGVPSATIFALHLESILNLLDTPLSGFDNVVKELAFIGVVSYTEAFFKDHFASVLNILPHKINGLKKGRNVDIDPTDLLELDEPIRNKFGFLLSERFDFGSPKAINALYRDALNITPFSVDNAAAYDKVLESRNLLVHHGGMITTQFNRNQPEARVRAFFDSIKVTTEQIARAALLAHGVVAGTLRVTIRVLAAEMKGIGRRDMRRQALEYMDDGFSEDSGVKAKLEAICEREDGER